MFTLTNALKATIVVAYAQGLYHRFPKYGFLDMINLSVVVILGGELYEILVKSI